MKTDLLISIIYFCGVLIYHMSCNEHEAIAANRLRSQILKKLHTLIASPRRHNGPRLKVRSERRRPPNIIVILADDLGYGDTSVSPFTGSGVKTPELEKMAAEGAILTNFHTAAATCTPSRYNRSLYFCCLLWHVYISILCYLGQLY